MAQDGSQPIESRAGSGPYPASGAPEQPYAVESGILPMRPGRPYTGLYLKLLGCNPLILGPNPVTDALPGAPWTLHPTWDSWGPTPWSLGLNFLTNYQKKLPFNDLREKVVKNLSDKTPLKLEWGREGVEEEVGKRQIKMWGVGCTLRQCFFFLPVKTHFCVFFCFLHG